MKIEKISDEISRIPLDSIVIEDRARKDLGDLSLLITSILKYGIVNPLNVEKSSMRLIAGERRATAARLAGLTTVPVRFLSDLTELERKELELEENLHEKLTWQEESALRAQIHDLLQKIHLDEGEQWRLEDTATRLGIGKSTLSHDITVTRASEALPKIKEFKTRKQAIKTLSKLKETAILTELARRYGGGNAETDRGGTLYALYNEDAIRCIRDSVPDNSVDLVIFDPPWGIDADIVATSRGPTGNKTAFDDSEEFAKRFGAAIVPELYRVMKNNTHMYMFFGHSLSEFWKEQLTKVGFSIRPLPLIWVKESGGYTDIEVKFMPRYEMIMFCSKGLRRINFACDDVFQYNRPVNTERIHTQQKPTELLEQLIRLSSVQGEIVLDPTMGSGATVVAATVLGRRSIGIERDKENFDKARYWISGIHPREEVEDASNIT